MRLLLTSLGLALCLVRPVPLWADAADICAKVGHDDRLYPYDPSMRQGFVRAYRRLFPRAKGVPGDPMLRADAVFRCMEGRLLVCFRGGSAPCEKIEAARRNPGAEAFCRAHPGTGQVPPSAAGRDAHLAFRCAGSAAEPAAPPWTLDARGFARDTWAPMD